MRYTLFGESHGPAVGIVAEGLPAGIPVDGAFMEQELLRRAGGTALTTARREPDRVKLLSGVFQGVTTGEPLCLVLENQNVRSEDYAALRCVPRPSHGDYAAWVKSGGRNDYRGGGHGSGRLSAPLVALGAVAQTALERQGVTVGAHLKAAGAAEDVPFETKSLTAETLRALKKKPFPALDDARGCLMQALILQAKAEGDSLGGVIEGAVLGLPTGLGGRDEWENLQCLLARRLFAIPAVKGVAFGDGFAFGGARGSQVNDALRTDGTAVYTQSNHCGGVTGGRSNGMPLLFTVAVKPTPSIAKAQRSVDLAAMRNTEIEIRGRHDPCVALRAVPAVEAAAALALLEVLPAEENDLDAMRREVDGVDRELMRLFETRMALSRRIGAYKRKNGLPVRDEARERAVARSRTALLLDESLRPSAAEWLEKLMELSRREQE